MIICVFALAGPAWKRESSPFAEDTAALFIIVKVTPSMMAKDIQPSRLERSVHKIHDLLAHRRGTLNGLIAYSGSAHMVMPLTRDTDIIETFAAELDPDIMPVKGDKLSDAIYMADAYLEKSGYPGSLLLITDGINGAELDILSEQRSPAGYPVHILAVAGNKDAHIPPDSPPVFPLDLESIDKAARKLNGTVTTVTADDRDVTKISARVEQALVTTTREEGGQRWRDFGYWIVPIIALFTLIWFRPGWLIVYE
jgi:Ca-activated chloride channel family protein